MADADRIDGVLEIRRPEGPSAPLVVDCPHSGAIYPADFDHLLPRLELRKKGDPYVDQLFEGAVANGAGYLRALFPRTYVDPNRFADEIDAALLPPGTSWPGPVRDSAAARAGTGVVWRQFEGGTKVIHGRQLSVAEIQRRIDGYWKPYHAALGQLLAQTRARHGVAYHLDCHSMHHHAPTGKPAPGAVRPDIVLGDMDGKSCEPGFTAFVAAWLRARGYSVVVNDPFKGRAICGLHGDPAAGIHSLQIEVSRGLYVDETSLVKKPGFGKLKRDMTGLSAAIAAYALDQAIKLKAPPPARRRAAAPRLGR